MNKHSWWKRIALVASSTLILGASACQTGDPRSLNGAGEITQGTFKACFIYEETLSDRRSINAAALTGLQKAADNLPIETFTYAQRDDSQRADTMKRLEKEGCSIILGVGFLLSRTIRDAARQYPQQHFAMIDSRLHEDDNEDQPLTLPNVKPLIFDTSGPSLLAGYLAGALSKSGVVATYGGVSSLPVRNYMDGFSLGVELYSQESHRPVTLLGWDRDAQKGQFVKDFYSVPVAKRITEEFINKKADVIFPVAGSAGEGTLQAIKHGSGVRMIGVDEDWTANFPQSAQSIPTSVLKNISEPVYEVIRDAYRGTFSSDPYVGTLRNGGVELAALLDAKDEVSPEVMERLEQLAQGIAGGSIRVNTKNHP